MVIELLSMPCGKLGGRYSPTAAVLPALTFSAGYKRPSASALPSKDFTS